MFRSHLLTGVVLITSVGLLVGCHSSAPPTTTSPSAAHSHASTQTPIATGQSKSNETTIVDAAPAPGTAQALAQRATNYAQSVEPIFLQHPASGPAETSDFPEHDWSRSTAELSPSRRTAVNEPLTPRASPPAVAPKKVAPPGAPQQPAPQNAQVAAAISTGSDSLGARLDKRAEDYPEDLTAQTDDQLLRLLKEESVPDMQSLSRLQPEDRELLSALMDALTNFRNQLRQNSNMIFSQKVAPLIDLSDRLRSQAELTIPTFVACTDALYFGNYTKLDPARFVAGQAHKIRIYYEVENFSSQLNNGKDYETKLGDQLVLYTESSGLPVWSAAKQNMRDISHRRRRDFFVAREIALPRTLTIGRYLLKVTVEDQQARRIAENTLPIEIVAQ